VEKQKCNIVWLKRDLRLQDHLPFNAAVRAGLPVLVLYCFEASLVNAAESSVRHWRFVWQSLQDIQRQLNQYKTSVFIFYEEVETILEKIANHYEIKTIFSTQEIGIKITFDRDKRIKKFCDNNKINWQEFPQDGIKRGRKNRIGWQAEMEEWLFSKPIKTDFSELISCKIPDRILKEISQRKIPKLWQENNEIFQPGGETFAQKYLQSFLTHRAALYNKQLSKPKASRKSCSRLSPYIAWGNITARQILLEVETALPRSQFSLMFNAFKERIWWRAHYLQKFESDCLMEFRPINRAFEKMPRNFTPQIFEAWATGKTGFPMIDASMRCLEQTGYLNFRMRAMLATFITFPLWQEWKVGAIHLAKLFLDFEPGIHYPQYQMQAGLTGYHTLRVYNPTIQAQQHDKEGTFIYEWVPELRNVPVPLLFEPWKMTALEQQWYRCEIGKDYPAPIVDFEKESRIAKERYWNFRNQKQTLAALPSVWERLCIPENRVLYEKQLGL